MQSVKSLFQICSVKAHAKTVSPKQKLMKKPHVQLLAEQPIAVIYLAPSVISLTVWQCRCMTHL